MMVKKENEESKAEVDNEEEEYKGVHDKNAKETNAKNDDVTVGFEIEGIGSVQFTKEGQREYAARITKSKIYDLATALGVEDFNKDEKGWSEEDRETAFAYLIDNEGNKILGLYLDIAPELEFDDANFPNKKSKIHKNYLSNPFEIKSVSPSGLFLLEKVDEKLTNIYRYVRTLNNQLPTIKYAKAKESATEAKATNNNIYWQFADILLNYCKNIKPDRMIQGTTHKTDINYGVPISTVDINKASKELKSAKGIDEAYSQDRRNEYPIKVPLEFIDPNNLGIRNVVPPTGASLYATRQRLFHLQYIKGQIIDYDKLDSNDPLKTKIEASIEYYDKLVNNNQEKDDKINVFNTVHDTIIIPDGKVIFEKREGYLSKDGISKLGYEAADGIKVSDQNSSIKKYYENVIKEKYCQKKLTIIKRDTIFKKDNKKNLNFKSNNNASYRRQMDASQNEIGSAYGNSNNIKAGGRQPRFTRNIDSGSSLRSRIVGWSQVKQKRALVVPRTASIDTPYGNYNATTAVNSTYIPPQKLQGIRGKSLRPSQNKGKFFYLRNENHESYGDKEELRKEVNKQKGASGGKGRM